MRVLFATTLALGLTTAAIAGPVSFASGWTEQRLQLFNSNSYRFGNTLGISSDGAVSLIWKRTAAADWTARRASWSWTVDQSVPATDLRRKGGDDRNISVYFVFLPQADAEAMRGATIRQLNNNPRVRILQYVWGGTHSRGTVMGSPYAPGQGANVILRPAGTGRHSERVDLARDYRTAFGGSPDALVGVAVSADSDDTNSRIRATLADLVLQQ